MELRLDHLFHALLVFFLILDIILSKELVVVFLTKFCGTEHDRVGDFKLEVALMVFHVILVDMEHRAEFNRIAIASGSGVESKLIANFLSYEESLLFLALEVLRANDAIFDYEATFFY